MTQAHVIVLSDIVTGVPQVGPASFRWTEQSIAATNWTDQSTSATNWTDQSTSATTWTEQQAA
jgi:hypothetical protein